MTFALQAVKKNPTTLVPVIFRIETRYYYGRHKAYLNSEELSAYPEEQECLLGDTALKVTGVEVVEKEFAGVVGPF